MGSNSRPTGTQWRKSSYSGDTGGSCVECAPLGPLTWRKSTYSGDQGGECVEVADIPTPTTIAIRDSKNPAGPTLTLDPATFTTFLNWAATTAE
ncbi:DUF397 domain-containing protein [Streptomyces phaeochromogenes]|uniref:DUF397 domain-containing protein n=1 Tax=Streptomyces phaeochromogenes TaxID=1923 RepID=UPI003864BD2C|nr:DUF397 domain-containing protein [Streptomyces phaeochromogenes]WSW14442.1 DUF397 domain-containing protein [Streptomyces phaeochromogenes]